MLYQQKLALTLPASGGHSAGIVRWPIVFSINAYTETCMNSWSRLWERINFYVMVTKYPVTNQKHMTCESWSSNSVVTMKIFFSGM
jgi:hypothetical protein